jgi:TolB-like protein
MVSALESSSWPSQHDHPGGDTPDAPRWSAASPEYDDLPRTPSPYLRPAPRAAGDLKPVVVAPEDAAPSASSFLRPPSDVHTLTRITASMNAEAAMHAPGHARVASDAAASGAARAPRGVTVGLAAAGLAAVALIAMVATAWLRGVPPRALLTRAAVPALPARPTAVELARPLPAPYERLARGPMNVGVTYFATASRDGDDAHLADVLTKAVIDRLRRARDRKGAPVAASFVAPGPTAQFTYSVTGSVGRDGEDVRCQVRVTTAEGTVIWQDNIKRPLVELDLLADDVSARVAARLAARLPAYSGHRVRRAGVPADSAEAFDRLLRGRYLRGRYDAASLEAAAAAYDLSARLAPRSPAAHAELAATYARLARWHGPRPAYLVAGRSAAQRALALDSGSALAWAAGASLAAQDTQLDRALVTAWARRAAAAAPTSPEGDRALALLHLRTGELGAAEAALRRVLARDPDDADAMSELAELHRRAGRLDAARTLLDRAVATSPTTIPAYAVRALVRARTRGQMREAFADAEVATQLGRPLWGEAVRAQLQAASRDRDGAIATARRVVARARVSREPISAWDRQFLHAAAGLAASRPGRPSVAAVSR